MSKMALKGVSVVLLTILGGVVSAAPTKVVVGGTAVVNGNYNEWDLGLDHYAEMHEEGNPDKTLLSNLYLRYYCPTQTLYALVLVQDGVSADLSAEDAWIKVYDLGNSTQVDGNSDSFAWLPNSQGYEASFTLAPGDYKFQAHLDVTYKGESGRTSSTGKKPGIPLKIECPTTPVPIPAAIVLLGVGLGSLGVISRKKLL